MFAEMTIEIILIYALTGVFAGLMGGMLGLGGGIIIVPVLHYVFTKQGFEPSVVMHQAVTTSLATIIVTSVFATYEHHRKEMVSWFFVNKVAPGIFLGACLGVLVADSVSSSALRTVFGCFEILVATQIWFGLKPKPMSTEFFSSHTQKKERYTKLPEKGVFIFTGAIIGLFSTILGIGGGTLTVPFLLWLNQHMRSAVAISSACSIPIALVATITFIFVSRDNSNIFTHSIGYLYWPAALIIVMMTIFFAPIGARLAHYLPIEILKRIFAVLLMFIGVKMLI